MSDNYPTAIVPVLPQSSHEKFDKLAQRFGDPMAKLFLIQNCGDPDLEFRAAETLMPYRYRKMRDVDDGLPGGGLGQVNVQINIGAPPVPKVDPLD